MESDILEMNSITSETWLAKCLDYLRQVMAYQKIKSIRFNGDIKEPDTKYKSINYYPFGVKVLHINLLIPILTSLSY